MELVCSRPLQPQVHTEGRTEGDKLRGHDGVKMDRSLQLLMIINLKKLLKVKIEDVPKIS